MKLKNIERSIIKTYRKSIWSPFIKALNEFQLIQDNDKIAVCISGGKDSFILAKCLQEIQKHGKMNFSLEFIVMDPGYKESHLKQIKKNAEILGISLKIFKSDVFAVANMLNTEKPCYMCARMRRGYLYDYAKKLGCNKIALGHHFDDVIETILLSMFYSGEFKTMMPKLHSDNFENMELIRPLYFVKEKDIISWASFNNLKFINCACSFTEKNSAEGKRAEIKNLINELRKNNKYFDFNIYNTVTNVNLSTIIGYHLGDKNYNFLDNYNK
ncbi:MAG: tRNA 2-thiocytidine biosynthesis protein TtcA [Bacilli bacterium]|nr:tRNA 2-thiocytidine biosynthesis protein TtcA [Bacilli bacterium]